MTVYMPDTDYKAICDATREKCGTTGLLKSWEIKPLLAALETGGAKFTLTVNVDSGSTVVATKGSLSVSGTAAGGVCVLTLPEAGDWMVSASLDGETVSKVVNVVGEYAAEAKFLPPLGTPLNDMSWEEISEIAKAGLASQYFNIGDCKEMVLDYSYSSFTLSNYTTYCFIIGIDHNAEIEGANLIHFQLAKTALADGIDIAFIDTYYESDSGCIKMTRGESNAGGWAGSLMKSTLCSGTPDSFTDVSFLAALPDDLRAVLAPVTKYTDNAGGASSVASNVTATVEYLFLLAEYEALGFVYRANTTEKNHQQQYAYYAAGNGLKKKKHTAIANGAYWWTRSAAVAANSSTFALISSTGNGSNTYGSYSYGFAPCFCIGGIE